MIELRHIVCPRCQTINRVLDARLAEAVSIWRSSRSFSVETIVCGVSYKSEKK